jgi:serine/threonine protein kinase/ABC-type branched-subunit amino acid transport system substrate-binding protein
MEYCINPGCSKRDNPKSAKYCQYCQTSLLIKDRYRIARSLLKYPHPYTEVFEVEDTLVSGTHKVLKTLKELNLLHAFEREHEILSSLMHPGIPKCEDWFFVPLDNNKFKLPCLVMEKIEGENLDDWLFQNQQLSNEKITLDWLEQITRILNYVHQKNVYHRDIKPSNIILKSTGRLVLIDFGIARHCSQTVINGRTVSLAYTPGYAPPEQLLSKPVPQSDFYALGRVFVHLLTGSHPQNIDPEFWTTATSFELSKGLRKLIDDCLAEHPSARPQTPQEILDRINRIKSPSPIPASNQRQPATQIAGQDLKSITPSQKYLLVALFAIAAALMAIAASLFIHRPQVSSTSPAPAPSVIASVQPELTPADKLISYGQQSIEQDKVPGLGTQAAARKKEGMEALKQGKFSAARNIFDEIRKDSNCKEKPGGDVACRDPEILIYRNNAESRRRSQAAGTPLYTIAVAAPLNIKGLIAKEILFGVAQAQNKFVSSRSAPQNIEIVIANDLGNMEQAKLVANKLAEGVEGRPILAVIGHYQSPVTCAALSIYSPNHIPLISAGSTATTIRDGSECNDINAVFFRTVSSTLEEARALSLHVKGDQKVAIFYNPKEKFSQSLQSQFQAQLSSRGIKSNDFSLIDEDFDPKEALEKARNFDVLAVFPDGKTGNKSDAFDRAIELIRLNQGRKPVLAANPLYTEVTLSRLQKSGAASIADWMLIAVDWHRDMEGAEGFNTDMSRLWGGESNRAVSAHEAVQAIASTLRPGITSKEIKNRLKAVNIDSDALEGRKIAFDPDTGDRKNLKRVLSTIVQVDGVAKFGLFKPGN